MIRSRKLKPRKTCPVCRGSGGDTSGLPGARRRQCRTCRGMGDVPAKPGEPGSWVPGSSS